MSNLAKCAKYTFQERSGYIIGSSNASAAHELVAIRHTASVVPWTDPGIHRHENSEEYYILLQGELRLLVAESLVTLKPREILMVKPQVPHAIIGGEGLIEHFGIRAPNLNDKHTVGEIPQRLLQGIEEERELQRDWGFRISLEVAKNRNCWLIGAGAARFQSPHLIFAYLDFPTAEAASAGIGTRHRLHFHQRSWEYYAVLKGTRTLQVDNELVRIEAGEILEVSPQVSHTLHSRQAPFEGFTFRVPVELNDKVECSALSDHNRPSMSNDRKMSANEAVRHAGRVVFGGGAERARTKSKHSPCDHGVLCPERPPACLAFYEGQRVSLVRDAAGRKALPFAAMSFNQRLR